MSSKRELILAAARSTKGAADDRARIRDAVRTKMTLGELAQARMRALAWISRPEP